jgi:hypothetical protein
MDKLVQQELESSGWKLVRDDQPGIYVKVEPINDQIDWTSAPTSMLADLERVRARRERHSRRRLHKKESRFVAPAG